MIKGSGIQEMCNPSLPGRTLAVLPQYTGKNGSRGRTRCFDVLWNLRSLFLDGNDFRLIGA